MHAVLPFYNYIYIFSIHYRVPPPHLRLAALVLFTEGAELPASLVLLRQALVQVLLQTTPLTLELLPLGPRETLC